MVISSSAAEGGSGIGEEIFCLEQNCKNFVASLIASSIFQLVYVCEAD